MIKVSLTDAQPSGLIHTNKIYPVGLYHVTVLLLNLLQKKEKKQTTQRNTIKVLEIEQKKVPLHHVSMNY